MSVSAGHAPDGRLMHVIRVRHANRYTTPSIFFVDLKVGSTKYVVDAQGVLDAPSEEATVYKRIKARPYFKETGRAEVRQEGNETTFLFSAEAIGNPKSYRWAAITNPAAGEVDYVDRAPNKGYKLHDLTAADVLQLPVKGGRVHWSIPCPPAAICQGAITIAGTEVLASGFYSVPGGETQDVALKLTAAGHRALERRTRLKAVATVLSTPTGNGSIPVVLTRASCEKPGRTTEARDACFKFSSSRSRARFECRLTGEGVSSKLKRWRRCKSPKRYRRLAPGKKRFQVRAIAGHRGKSDRWSWRVLP